MTDYSITENIVCEGDIRKISAAPGGGREEQAGGDREFISTLNKYSICLKNWLTGQWIIVDSRQLRINRLEHRLREWAGVIFNKMASLKVRFEKFELSYADNRTWCKNDIGEYISKVAGQVGKENIAGYVWVLENKTGVTKNYHYHVCFCVLASAHKIKFADKSGHWSKGSTYKSKNDTGFSVKYMMKYLGKPGGQKDFNVLPKGARLFAVYLNKKYFTLDDLMTVRRAGYPGWLVTELYRRGLLHWSCSRASGGGWLIKDLDKPIFGEDGKEIYLYLESPFQVLLKGKSDIESHLWLLQH